MSDAEWDADDFEPPKASTGAATGFKVSIFLTEFFDGHLATLINTKRWIFRFDISIFS